MEVIQVKNLTKKFEKLVAVDHVSFDVGEGEIFGFLGPNGAGKSTTISMLSTLLIPTEGDARINNFSILTERNEVRRSIGLVFQDPSLDDRLTAAENLHFHARLYHVPSHEYDLRVHEVLKLVDLWDRKDDIVKAFSGGMKRRLEIARGLIHYPKVLFLDEPTIGLDPQTRAHLWDYIIKLKREKNMTIFMTTHYMNEAEYCDRIGIIDRGKIVALDTPANLKKRVGGDVIRLQSASRDMLKKEITAKFGKTAVDLDGFLQFEVDDASTFLPQLLGSLKSGIHSVELHKPTLDDVFLKLTGRAIREEEASAKDFMRTHMRMRGH
jgi:ABC-2 type transport system ATP-binding protein